MQTYLLVRHTADALNKHKNCIYISQQWRCMSISIACATACLHGMMLVMVFFCVEEKYRNTGSPIEPETRTQFFRCNWLNWVIYLAVRRGDRERSGETVGYEIKVKIMTIIRVIVSWYINIGDGFLFESIHFHRVLVAQLFKSIETMSEQRQDLNWKIKTVSIHQFTSPSCCSTMKFIIHE